MKIFFIDPQSYNNLSIYDSSLMECIPDADITYFHNVKYHIGRVAGVDYRDVFNYSDKTGILKGLSYLLSILKIACFAMKKRPDVVHVQWFRLFTVDRLFVLFLHVHGIKVVHTAHNVLPHNPTPSARHQYNWYYRNADAIIVHTMRSKNELTEEFGVKDDKVHVIPHGMLPSTVDTYKVKTRMTQLSNELNLQGKTVFASMGFQNHYKGIDIIIEAWLRNPQLCQNDTIALLVVGKVENADVTALSSCNNAYFFDKEVNDVDFDAYLQLASVVLMPYRKISQSGVLLTALQRGVPVLVSDAGGLKEPLAYGQVGWCIGGANVENLETQLLMFANHPQILIDCRNDENAFDKVRSAFSWREIGQATRQLYATL